MKKGFSILNLLLLAGSLSFLGCSKEESPSAEPELMGEWILVEEYLSNEPYNTETITFPCNNDLCERLVFEENHYTFLHFVDGFSSSCEGEYKVLGKSIVMNAEDDFCSFGKADFEIIQGELPDQASLIITFINEEQHSTGYLRFVRSLSSL